jgi:GNAT superfamily N-acetyltransferase
VSATLGPPATFLPANPVVFLTVGGDAVAAGTLHELRDRVLVPPLWRQVDLDFVPHVTIAEAMDPDRIPSAVLALADFAVPVTFGSVQLLEQTRHGDAHRRWLPIAEYRLAPPAVVGRGGVELTLWVSGVADPDAVAVEACAADELAVSDPPVPLASGAARPGVDLARAREVPPGAVAVVVMARSGDELVGVARGWRGAGGSDVSSVVVAPAWRGRGVARQLLLALDAELARVRPG